MKIPKITAPVSNYTTLKAALDGGADSIYFGVDALNMRIGASQHFSLEDLDQIAAICHQKNKECYLTLNTIIYDDDISLMQKICTMAKKAKIDAIIASDIAVIQYARSIGLSIHLSTQMNITNMQEIRFYAQYADAIVLARELSLEQIQYICQTIQEEKILGPSKKLLQIEIFIHGALCVGISGKCYMSLAQYNHSANRGECLQACRRKYRVQEEETGKELIIDNSFIMSPKDLCTIGILDQIVASGVSIVKIEGRGKSPEYVKTVVHTYKQALFSIQEQNFSSDKIEKWISCLKRVYNRSFWHGGYYLRNNSENMWSKSYGSQSTRKKYYVGKITNYFSQKKIAECLLQAKDLNIEDHILITGPTTGAIEDTILSIRKHPKTSKNKGTVVTFPLLSPVRRNDAVYLITMKDLCTKS